MFDAVLLFREALYGALVIGLACSVLGVYVVLRRIVFVGAALADSRRRHRHSHCGWRDADGCSASPPIHRIGPHLTIAGVLFFGAGRRQG